MAIMLSDIFLGKVAERVCHLVSYLWVNLTSGFNIFIVLISMICISVHVVSVVCNITDWCHLYLWLADHFTNKCTFIEHHPKKLRNLIILLGNKSMCKIIAWWDIGMESLNVLHLLTNFSYIISTSLPYYILSL